MSDDKREEGGLNVDVSADVIQAALDAVEGKSAQPLSGDEVPSEGGADATALEKDLKDVRSQLDLSIERARETLERLKDTHERYLRAVADLENYKKRAVREREEASKFGTERLLKDLLPVVDNLDRALDHAEVENPLSEGIKATRRLFEDTLAKYGVKGFTAVGTPFDPARHEAMQQTETTEVPPGTVASEMVRGYLLHDRLVRPALVSVAIAPAGAKAESADAETTPPTDPAGAGETS